jgi:hypothetical protein
MKTALAFLAAACLALLAASCADNLFEPRGNLPPETGLAITGDSLATTLYKVHLKWWGSDTDGEVAGFQYKWTGPPGSETYELETEWTYTSFTKNTFLLPVPDSLSSYLFEVRAVDDQGLVDPTPAAQEYPFYNNRPTVTIRFREVLPDSAWPVLPFGWESTDPEGDSTIARHLIWVKGREGTPKEVPGDADTVLLLPADIDTFGAVTVCIQAVDEAHGASAADSFDIYFHKIQGSILLVDDFDPGATPIVNPDAFYRGLLTARVGEESYTVLDLKTRAFDSNLRFAGFLTAFDHVVWYTGTRQRSVLADPARFTQMTLADSGLGAFLMRGGNLFMESLNAVGTYGGLTPGFPARYMGFEELSINPVTGGTNFEFLPAVPPVPRPCEVPFLAVPGTGLPDLYLRCPIQYPGIDSPIDTAASFAAERLYRVPMGTFKNQPGEFTPAIRYDLPSPGGRVILCTFPFSMYYGDPGNNDEAFAAFLDWFGVP